VGFSYRKSVKAGPFRITASKSGISYSAGVKGARVTKRANGRVQTTLSAPGTGLRYTTTTGTKSRQAARTTGSRQAPARRTASAPRPVPRPRPAAAPKPKPLPGRRFTVAPRIPPAWQLPVSVKGYLATVMLHQGGIQIDRTRMGRVNGNHSAAIAWPELAGIDFLKPTLFRNGHVHFATTADSRGLTATGRGNRMAAAARNPHAIMFTWQQRRAYKRLRDLLTGNGYIPPTPV
jgi:hypothetical protein